MINVVETAEAVANTGWLREEGMASHNRRSTLADHVLWDSGVTFKAQAIFILRSASFTADVIFLRMNFRNSAWRHGRVTIET